MTCPHCGAQMIPGNRFCHKCRKRVAAGPGAASGAAPAARRATAPPRAAAAPQGDVGGGPSTFTRPGLITVLAVLNLLGGVLAVGASATMVFAMLASDPGGEGTTVMVAILAVYAVVGAVQLATGVGLLRLAPWGRAMQIGLAGLGLLGIPCGTIISILILVYMLKPEMKTLFSGISPRRLPPAEVARVEALSQGSGAMVALVAVVVAIAGIAFVGIVAAIAIPSLLRARVSANESVAIGSLRTIVSAEESYRSANGGYADELECLVEPTQCIPGYPAVSPSFLDSSLLAEHRSGYEYVFVPGSPAPPEVVQEGQVSETSMESWALVAVPLQPGQSGIRAFCADMSGALCVTADGNAPDVSSGACPVWDESGPGGCTLLR